MANIVIVGGGVSGLSAGIYAQLIGHNATVLEKHSRAGGNLTGWQRSGYHIDNCIHWLTGTDPSSATYKTWCELGALGEGVEVYYPDSLYTCSREGQSVSLFLDIERTRNEMLEISPEDKAEIDDLIGAVRAVMGLMGLEGFSRVKGVMMMPRLIKYYVLSTGELSGRFKHPLLRDFIRGVMGEDFGAIALVSVFAIFCGKNGGIPRGGSVGMADRMANRFLSLGGRLLLKSEVVSIDKEGKRVTAVHTSDGREIGADYVVMCGDPATSFQRLLGINMPKTLEKQYNDPKMKRFSSLHFAFSCDESALPFEADHIFLMPRRAQRALGSKYLVLREFSHEKSYAPQGKNVVQALAFCYERRARELIELSHDADAYKTKKEELASLVQNLIEEKFPMLCDKLRLLDVWTPATYVRYTNCEMGSYMSFILPPKTIPKRLGCRVDGIDNLFLATQWQQAPGGLPTAAACGRAAIKAIDRRERSIVRAGGRRKEVYAGEITQG